MMNTRIRGILTNSTLKSFKDKLYDKKVIKAMFEYMQYLRTFDFFQRKNTLTPEMTQGLDDDDFFKKMLKFLTGVTSIPHFNKKEKGGEDSFYVSDNILVVADGVGGWNNLGVDPGLYSKELCENVMLCFSYQTSITEKTPKDILIRSVCNTRSQGSSTCCILLLDDKSKKIHTSYIGDSLYMIVRYVNESFVVEYKSKEQIHGFNTPFQVGTRGDDPETALSNSHDAVDKDVLIVATDGLWDNLDNDQILSILNKNNIKGTLNSIEYISQCLASEAERLSFDKTYLSPFAKRKNEIRKINATGGKPDDITVIVAQIQMKQNVSKINSTITVSKTKVSDIIDSNL